ncbi:hypothetical protein AB0C94_34390, partial [Streptomyces griseus]
MARRRCYPSDTFDDEWALIEPLLPPPACESRRGGRRACRRTACYVRSGCGIRRFGGARAGAQKGWS